MSDINDLMDRDPLELSEQDIDAIIAYQRKMRGLAESGKRPKKEAGPTKKLSLLDLGITAKAEPATLGVRRRV